MNTRFPKLILIVLIYTGLAANIYSQETTPKLSLDKGTIENGFNYVIKNASDFQDSKVVKSWWLWRLKSYVLDSLATYRDSVNGAYRIVYVKEQQIDSLKADLQAINIELAAAIKEKNSLNLIGMSMSKSFYNSILWSIIGILIVALIVFIILFKRSNHITSASRLSLAEIKEEFETFRKRALEREQQIARELYDEVIKYKKKLGEL